jgi:hypothetical protein
LIAGASAPETNRSTHRHVGLAIHQFGVHAGWRLTPSPARDLCC